jgi:2-haloacid dehalogenase
MLAREVARLEGVCVFDVNETLLDLTAPDPPFERAFGRPGVRREWFGQLLQSAFVSTITDAYTDFGTIGRGALEMVARRNGVELTTDEQDSIVGAMPTLPPHPEGLSSTRSVSDSPDRCGR